MVVITDKYHVFLVGEESTFNTEVAATKDLGLIQDAPSDETRNHIDVYTTGARAQQATPVGTYNLSLGVEGIWQHGRPLEMFFGNPTSTETTGDYRHVFVDLANTLGDGAKTLTDEPLSYSIESSFNASSDFEFKWAGCKLNTLTLTTAVNDVLKFSAQIIGSSPVPSTTASTKVISSDDPFEHFRGTIDAGDDASEAAVTLVQNFEIQLNNNMEPVDSVAAQTHQEIAARNLGVTYTFSKVFDSFTDYYRFIDHTTQLSTGTPTATSLIFNYNNGVALGSGRREVGIKLKETQYKTVGRPVPVGEKVVATFTGGGGTVDYAFTVDQNATLF